MNTEFMLEDDTKQDLEATITEDIKDELENVPGLDFEAVLDWAATSFDYGLQLDQCTSDIAETTYGYLNTADKYELAAENQDFRMKLDSEHRNHQHMETAMEQALVELKQDALEQLLEKFSDREIFIATGYWDWNYPATHEEIELAKKYKGMHEIGLKPITKYSA